MLIGVTGLAGAGKTTAVDYLARKMPGTKFYVGQLVQDDVRRLRLKISPENEKRVRAAIRRQEGSDAFARRALPFIAEILILGPALIDAIYVKAEWQLYRNQFTDRAILLRIETRQETRVERLAERPERKLSRDDLIQRDAFELDQLRLGEVFDLADYFLSNDDSMEELEQQLDALVSLWRTPVPRTN